MANVVPQKDLHRIVLTAIIYRPKEDGGFEYLVTKRSPDKKVYPNLWTVPGGGLEAGDYENKEKTTSEGWYFVLEDVLRREVRTEVNIEIGKPKYLLDLIFIRPDGVPVVTLSYYVPFIGGEVKLVDEEEGGDTEFRWITPTEALEIEMIPGIPQEIEAVDRILSGEEDPKISFK
jgi:8-oxo-dGTP pyrophosphatase MutT (NUDIX family)